MAALMQRALLFTALLAGAGAVRAGTGMAANPIRRVVTMLQMMQKKITEEREKDEELYEKFQCYCKDGAKTLEAAISAAEAKVPQVSSSLDEATAHEDQLGRELAQHKADRADAKAAIAEASSLREKQAADYAKESSDDKTNIAALGKAIEALETGMGSFLQTSSANVLRKLALNMELSSGDRDTLVSFLSQREGQSYVPQSGQIVGILKQMKDTMEKALADVEATEAKDKEDYNSLVAAKEKEIRSHTQAIESKLGRHGQVGLEIESLKEDLEDTTKALMDDKKFLADLDSNCDKKKSEWETIQKTRAEELVAIAETIKILNEDDALELFKKTLPSPSLLQTRASGVEVKNRALQVLAAARHHSGKSDPNLDLLVLALHGKKVSFEKVLSMIDKMVSLLGEEQVEDDKKKAYCEAQLDKNEDLKKELDLGASDLSKAIAEAEETISTLSAEVSALEKGISDLDKQVTEATENRKAEHADNMKTLTDNQQAKEVLGQAINRLHQFYNPKLYKPPPKKEVSREEQIVINFNGLLQFGSQQQHSRDAPAPPPEAFSPYATKGQESTGVLEMINMLVADLDKEMSEVQVEEKEAQKEYEQLMADSAAKRTADAKSIQQKESAKADLEAESQKMSLQKKSTLMEAMATAETIKDLHLSCDWLLANFEARKEARAGELDSLKNAKAVLSGADYSLVQTAHHISH